MKQLWRLPAGSLFWDYRKKQLFVKESTVMGRRRRPMRLHQVRCLISPFRKEPGPICSAFFTHVGATLYLGGSKEVYPVEVR